MLLLYAAIGTIAILVLRGMSRRWREGEPEPEGTPYAPQTRADGPETFHIESLRPVGGDFE